MQYPTGVATPELDSPGAGDPRDVPCPGLRPGGRLAGRFPPRAGGRSGNVESRYPRSGYKIRV